MIQYKINTANKVEIINHLELCKSNFIPPLDKTVNINNYGAKLKAKSITFEAWFKNSLIGLVASYFNDYNTLTGFITNVSVIREFMGQGISLILLDLCINYAKKENFSSIKLAVHKDNNKSIYLYQKRNFRIKDIIDDNNLLIMQLDL